MGLRAKLVSLFEDGEPAPPSIVKDFESLERDGRAVGFAFGVVAAEARKVLEVTLDGGVTGIVYVAPRHTGGFCATVAVRAAAPGASAEPMTGGCVDESQPPLTTGVAMSGPIDASGTILGGVVLVHGTLNLTAAASLVVLYEDGSQASVPFVRVSEPIGVALYLYAVPRRHWTPGRLPVAIVARDAEGRELARDTTVVRAFALVTPAKPARRQRKRDAEGEEHSWSLRACDHPGMLIRSADVDPFDFDGLVIADYTTGRGELSSSLARIEVPTGVAHMVSWSTRSDKYYYVVSGALRFEIDGTSEKVDAGDAIVIRQGQRFRYENDAAEPAVLLLVHTPPFLLEAERFEP